MTLFRRVTAAIAEGKRPVPFRTRKLSPPAPMVLHSTGCGRVGHRRTQRETNNPRPSRSGVVCIRNQHQHNRIHRSRRTERAGIDTCTPSPIIAIRTLRPPRLRAANARALAGREQNSDTRLHAPDKRARIRLAPEVPAPRRLRQCRTFTRNTHPPSHTRAQRADKGDR